jgi:septal ring factor EnvC (AmiA/AmiB activator)
MRLEGYEAFSVDEITQAIDSRVLFFIDKARQEERKQTKGFDETIRQLNAELDDLEQWNSDLVKALQESSQLVSYYQKEIEESAKSNEQPIAAIPNPDSNAVRVPNTKGFRRNKSNPLPNSKRKRNRV